MPLRISLDEIQSPEQALQMAEQRNHVRAFMTHNTDKISPDQQLEWYYHQYMPARSTGDMYGHLLNRNGEPIGYGLITHRQDRYWVSGGVQQTERAKGYGRLLFNTMTRFIHEQLDEEEAWLDVRRVNHRAIDLYRGLGYFAVSGDNELIYMVHKSGGSDV